MTETARTSAAAAILLLLSAVSAPAQTFEGPGTRAQGMGAFVAVADDASAVYWNPGGLASGAYFSLLIDRTDGTSGGSGETRAGGRSSWLIALSAPAVGLSYYRLRSTIVGPGDPQPAGEPDLSRVESLVTHHAGATVVQSLAGRLAVGATVKMVRGIATIGQARGDAEDLADDWELLGVASNHFDVDVGVMATGNLVRAGVTFRNLARPEFSTGTAEPLRLDRQARAGLALLLTQRWTAAVDLDLTRNRGPFGDTRTLAFGAEGRVTSRAVARGGIQLNTAGGDGLTPVASLGASYAALGSLLIDAHFSKGSDRGFGGWGIAGRVVF